MQQCLQQGRPWLKAVPLHPTSDEQIHRLISVCLYFCLSVSLFSLSHWASVPFSKAKDTETEPRASWVSYQSETWKGRSVNLNSQLLKYPEWLFTRFAFSTSSLISVKSLLIINTFFLEVIWADLSPLQLNILFGAVVSVLKKLRVKVTS